MFALDNISKHLYENAESAIKFLLDRNKDFSVSEHTEDIDIDFFGYARAMEIVICGVKYSIDSLTTLKDIKFIRDNLYTDKVEYMTELSNDIDTIVGDINKFLDENGIDNSDYLGPTRYYNVIESGKYKLSTDDIIMALKSIHGE